MKLRIAEARNDKGVSQRELAARVGATMSMIGKLERGERQMTFNWLQRIGLALDVPTGELIDASNEPADAGTVLADGEIYVDQEADWPEPKSFDDAPTFHIPSAEFSNRCSVTLNKDMQVRLPADTRFIYTLPMQTATKELVNRLAVIWLAGEAKGGAGGQYLGYILPGTTPKRFHVMPLNGPIVEDVEIHSMALISEIDVPPRTGGA